jgi:7-carboxy-7-deazaguanine synthase
MKKIHEVDLKSIKPIIEIFNSIEGEGITAGKPTIFVRLTGCNLRCCFDNSICDTAYSSFCPDKGKFTYEDLIKEIQKNRLSRSLSITGGEPFLHAEVVNDMIDIASYYGMKVLIETNGTISPKYSLIKKVDLMSISPKLSSSEPTEEKCAKMGIPFTETMQKHAEKRFNPEALWDLITFSKDFQLKYVVGSHKDFIEIEEQIQKLIKLDCFKKNRAMSPLFSEPGTCAWYDKEFITPDKIVLMPAGATNGELDQNRSMVASYCAERGFIYSDRLQIVIWGTERNR